MARLAPAIIVLSVVAATGALAQTGGQTGRQPGGSGSGASLPPSVWPAPVGHRQPTRAEVGGNDANSSMDAQDKELDRKLKSICRGC